MLIHSKLPIRTSCTKLESVHRGYGTACGNMENDCWAQLNDKKTNETFASYDKCGFYDHAESACRYGFVSSNGCGFWPNLDKGVNLLFMSIVGWECNSDNTQCYLGTLC